MSIKRDLKKIEDRIGAHDKPIIIGALGSDGFVRYEGEFMSEADFLKRFPDDRYSVAIFEFGFPMRRGEDYEHQE